MKDLISREALLQQIGEKLNVLRGCNDFKEAWGMRYAMVMIQNAPAVDAVEVVHAKWVDEYGGRYENKKMKCSACKEKAHHNDFEWILTPFCPNCGAKMDGE